MAGTAEPQGTRRDFLYIATGATAAVAAGSFAWPLINQMNADAGTRALASIKVKYDSVEAGQQITTIWLGKTVFIRRRTEQEIAASRRDDDANLVDTIARNANLAEDAIASDENRSFKDGEFIVCLGVCTHLGCVPTVTEGDYDGWYCKCHGSHYDLAARIRRGPAPENLHIPTVEFLDDNATIKIG